MTDDGIRVEEVQTAEKSSIKENTWLRSPEDWDKCYGYLFSAQIKQFFLKMSRKSCPFTEKRRNYDYNSGKVGA